MQSDVRIEIWAENKRAHNEKEMYGGDEIKHIK